MAHSHAHWMLMRLMILTKSGLKFQKKLVTQLLKLRKLSNQLKSFTLFWTIPELSSSLFPMVLYLPMLVVEVMLETSSEDVSASWKRMIGGTNLVWKDFWISLSSIRKILKEFTENSQSTKVLLKSLESNMTDGNIQMMNLSKNLKKLSNKKKENSQLMIGFNACKLSVSQPIKLLKLWNNQFHKVCIMKLPWDKKRLLRKRKPFFITHIICKRLIKLFTKIIISWISMPPSLKFSKMWNKTIFQISSFLINLLFIQLQEDNNTILELWLSLESLVPTRLLMPSRLENAFCIFLIDHLRDTLNTSKERKPMWSSMLIEESNYKLIILELISYLLHAEKFLVHISGKMVLRKLLTWLI